MIQITLYRDEHFDAVDRLWLTTFPNDPERNRAAIAIPEKLAVDDGLFWVALGQEDRVIGTIMAGWDGHRGWLYSVACDPNERRKGIGTALVERAISELKMRGCRKANLQIRAGNEAVTQFYQSLGFEVEPRTSMGREL